MRIHLAIGPSAVVLALVAASAPAQETPTEREAAQSVIQKLDALERSLEPSADQFIETLEAMTVVEAKVKDGPAAAGVASSVSSSKACATSPSMPPSS